MAPRGASLKRLRSKSTTVSEEEKLPPPPTSDDTTSLLAARAKQCEQCGQNAHMYDRDCAPALAYLRWSKFDKRDGGLSPFGRECYYCVGIRRRFYGCNLETLKEARRSSRDEGAKFTMSRRDKASGENKCRNEARSELKHIMKKEDDQFVEAYETGTFVTLDRFASENNLHGNNHGLAEIATQRFGFEVGTGKTGVLGVFVVAQGDGEYKFKRGLRNSVKQVVSEAFQDAVVARERAEEFMSGASATELGHVPGGEDDHDEGTYMPLGNVAVHTTWFIPGSGGASAGPSGSNASASAVAGTGDARDASPLPIPPPLDGDIGHHHGPLLGSAASMKDASWAMLARQAPSEAACSSSSRSSLRCGWPMAPGTPSSAVATPVSATRQVEPALDETGAKTKKHKVEEYLSPENLWDRKVAFLVAAANSLDP